MARPLFVATLVALCGAVTCEAADVVYKWEVWGYRQTIAGKVYFGTFDTFEGAADQKESLMKQAESTATDKPYGIAIYKVTFIKGLRQPPNGKNIVQETQASSSGTGDTIKQSAPAEPANLGTLEQPKKPKQSQPAIAPKKPLSGSTIDDTAAERRNRNQYDADFNAKMRELKSRTGISNPVLDHDPPKHTNASSIVGTWTDGRGDKAMKYQFNSDKTGVVSFSGSKIFPFSWSEDGDKIRYHRLKFPHDNAISDATIAKENKSGQWFRVDGDQAVLGQDVDSRTVKFRRER